MWPIQMDDQGLFRCALTISAVVVNQDVIFLWINSLSTLGCFRSSLLVFFPISLQPLISLDYRSCFFGFLKIWSLLIDLPFHDLSVVWNR